MIINDLLVKGTGRFVDNVYASEFVGDLDGNAETSTYATYVKQNSSNASYGRPILLAYQESPVDGTASNVYYDSSVTVNPSTNTITADTFKGYLNGNAKSVNNVIPEWSGSISYNDTNWLAAWTSDGTKIKALDKNNFAPASHTHNYAGSSSAGGSANSAVKLDTASAGYSNRPVYFADGKPVPVTSVKQSLITWDSDNLSGTFTPIDAGIAPKLGANRLAFMPPDAITVEYSRDGGNTWSAYNVSDIETRKKLLFSGINTSLYIGGSGSSGVDKSNHMLRITVDTVSGSVYTHLHKFALLISTEGSTGSYVTLTGRTKANYDAGTDTWTTFVDKATLSGWSGWNILNTSFTAGNSSSGHYRQFRFTFGVTSHASSVAYGGLMVYSILGFGGVGWTTPSNMAGLGTLYNYDGDQNALFPRDVYATTFRGALSGNVTGNLTGNVTGNADTSTQIKYSSQLTSDDAINNFNAANRMQVATWNSTSSPGVTNGIILSTGWTTTGYGAQIAIDDDPTYYIALRQRNGDGWKAWKQIPMGDGTGASGTWGISISGNAATATKATQDASGNTITSTYATKTELNNKSKVQIVRW